MKQKDIRLGVLHHIETCPSHVDSWDWIGVKAPRYGVASEIPATVIRKGLPNPDNSRWKDRVEVKIDDDYYRKHIIQELKDDGTKTDRTKETIEIDRSRYPQTQIIPARHVAEGVEARIKRIAEQEYDNLWRAALRENEARSRVTKLNTVGIVRHIDSTRRAAQAATRDHINALTTLKDALAERIEELESELDTDGSLPEPVTGSALPVPETYWISSKLENTQKSIRGFDRAVGAWNSLVDLGVGFHDE